MRTLGQDVNGVWTDGNCLFHAVWLQLQPELAFVSVDDLRAWAVGFLRHDPDIQNIGAVNDAYLATMQQPGTWGGALEAFALAHSIGVQIDVYCTNIQGNPVITFNAERATTIRLNYDGTHYTVGRVIPAPQTSTSISTSTSTSTAGPK